MVIIGPPQMSSPVNFILHMSSSGYKENMLDFHITSRYDLYSVYKYLNNSPLISYVFRVKLDPFIS